MKAGLIPIFLFFFFIEEILGHQQLISVLPTGAVGIGGQPIYSTVPISGTGQQVYVQQQQVPSSLLQQILRLGNGGVTQVVGQPGVTQLVNGAGLTQPLVVTTNGVGVTGTSTLPYPYSVGGLTATNINGVPVLVATSPAALSGLGIQNGGFQTLPVSTQFLQQPVMNVNPVIRQVEEEEEIDPLDAALLDMENKGQMHMEKYAWGRSSPLMEALAPKQTSTNSNLSTEDSDPSKELRSANYPLYYNNPLPTVQVPLPSPPVSAPSPTLNRVRTPPNPFTDGQGKRKKHFELYQYFRNLDLNSPGFLVPIGSGTIPSS